MYAIDSKTPNPASATVTSVAAASATATAIKSYAMPRHAVGRQYTEEKLKNEYEKIKTTRRQLSDEEFDSWVELYYGSKEFPYYTSQLLWLFVNLNICPDQLLSSNHAGFPILYGIYQARLKIILPEILALGDIITKQQESNWGNWEHLTEKASHYKIRLTACKKESKIPPEDFNRIAEESERRHQENFPIDGNATVQQLQDILESFATELLDNCLKAETDQTKLKELGKIGASLVTFAEAYDVTINTRDSEEKTSITSTAFSLALPERVLKVFIAQIKIKQKERQDEKLPQKKAELAILDYLIIKLEALNLKAVVAAFLVKKKKDPLSLDEPQTPEQEIFKVFLEIVNSAVKLDDFSKMLKPNHSIALLLAAINAMRIATGSLLLNTDLHSKLLGFFTRDEYGYASRIEDKVEGWLVIEAIQQENTFVATTPLPKTATEIAAEAAASTAAVAATTTPAPTLASNATVVITNLEFPTAASVVTPQPKVTTVDEFDFGVDDVYAALEQEDTTLSNIHTPARQHSPPPRADSPANGRATAIAARLLAAADAKSAQIAADHASAISAASATATIPVAPKKRLG
jgi:hypothetical protein